MKAVRKVFTVVIHKKKYDVFDIDGKEHEGLNGEPKSWWLYYSDSMPEGTTPPVDSEYWRPYHRSIERHCFDIRISQVNTTKEKWGETQFRNHTQCEIICNDNLFYSFGTIGGDRGIAFAMAKAQYFITMLGEHPFNFYNPRSEDGRKIWWYGLPATIKTRSDAWEITVYPDYTTGIDKETWWKELEKRETKLGSKPAPDWAENESEQKHERLQSESINWGDAFSDQHIDWFRK